MAMEGVVARVRTGVLKAWLLSKGIDLRGCVERRDLENEAKKLNGQENDLEAFVVRSAAQQEEEEGRAKRRRAGSTPPAESEAQEEAGEADRGDDEGVIAAVREAAEGGSDFVKCGSFAGALPGFSFKLGKEGLGYYREAAGVASRAEEVPTKSRGPGPEPSSSSKRNCRHGTESAAREDGLFDGWSIKEIKRWLGDRGLGTEGCLERSDLVARAMEARRGAAVPPAAPSRPLPPPAFELMRVEGVHPSGRRLQDLCSGSVRAALVSNYMIDAPWFAQEFPDLVSSEELIVCHDGKSGMRREAEALWGELKRARLRHGLGSGGRGRLVVHAPDLPIPYGTHHSKFFVLVYTDGRLRLIIHSANLLHGDCTHKTQAVWFQDFYAKKPGDVTCAFEVDLLAYLGALGLPRECGGFLGEVGKVDFFKARALGLVASVPGYHRGGQRDRYGHMRLRGILSRQRWPTEFKESDLVCQFSSLGSIDEKWLKSEFTESMASQMASDREWFDRELYLIDLEREGVKLGPNFPFFHGQLHLVWPTVAEVMGSLEGAAAGQSIPGYEKNVTKAFLQPLYRKWGRCPAAPHMKFYGRFSSGCREPRFCWAAVGSHNLSKAAWGCLQKKETQLFVRSYELSVVVCGTEATVPVPFQWPLKAYDEGRDVPWTVG